MSQKTPDQITQKFRSKVAGAGSDYAAGVAAPSRPWAQATVQGAARYQAGVAKAISEKRFEKGVQAAGDAKWSENAQGKGAARYTQAADSAATAYAKVAGDVMSASGAARSAVQSMPDTSLEARIARSAAAQMATSKYWAAKRR